MLEIEEGLRLQEIEKAFYNFQVCPKCNSKTGFWLGLKGDHAHAQCKNCGASFELFEVYAIGENEKSKRFRFLRR